MGKVINKNMQYVLDSIVMREIVINIESVRDKNKYSKENYKNGVYYLFDGNYQIIYVGKVGNNLNTSLYHRIYGHGIGAHKNKKWFKQVKKCIFHKFEGFDKSEILQIERLLIYLHQPTYNDIVLTQETINNLHDKIKELNL